MFCIAMALGFVELPRRRKSGLGGALEHLLGDIHTLLFVIHARLLYKVPYPFFLGGV